MTVKNVTKIIKILFPNDYSFYVLGNFNLPKVDWTIPGTDFNDFHKCFLDFCTDNFLTQLIKGPTHKNGNILDLLIYNNFGLDRIISHSVTFPLTNTCDLKLKFKVKNLSILKKIHMIFKMQILKTSIITSQNIIGLHYFTSQKISNIFMTNLSAQFKRFISKITKVRNIHITLKIY